MYATQPPPFASDSEPPPAAFDVVLPDALGHPALGFRDGMWFLVGHSHPPRPLAARNAILGYPDAAGSIVQIMCWWMREHPGHCQAVDLATELALLVGDLSRSTPGPGSSLPGLRPASRAASRPVTPPALGAAARPALEPAHPAPQPALEPAVQPALRPAARPALGQPPEARDALPGTRGVRALPPVLPAHSGRW